MSQFRRPSHIAGALLTEGIAVHEVWPYVLILFLGGGTMTALGIMVLSNDLLVFAGIVLTSVGIAGMWLPGRGPVRNGKALAIASFLFGNVCTAASLTLSASNNLLLTGMIFSSAGIGSMWLIGKRGLLPIIIWWTFVVGTALQALGLTVLPSKLIVSAGMMLVSGSVFGMWMKTHPAPHLRDWERQEVVNIGIEGERHAAEMQHHTSQTAQHAVETGQRTVEMSPPAAEMDHSV